MRFEGERLALAHAQMPSPCLRCPPAVHRSGANRVLPTPPHRQGANIQRMRPQTAPGPVPRRVPHGRAAEGVGLLQGGRLLIRRGSQEWAGRKDGPSQSRGEGGRGGGREGPPGSLSTTMIGQYR